MDVFDECPCHSRQDVPIPSNRRHGSVGWQGREHPNDPCWVGLALQGLREKATCAGPCDVPLAELNARRKTKGGWALRHSKPCAASGMDAKQAMRIILNLLS